jgi:hypothetical protein
VVNQQGLTVRHKPLSFSSRCRGGRALSSVGGKTVSLIMLVEPEFATPPFCMAFSSLWSFPRSASRLKGEGTRIWVGTYPPSSTYNLRTSPLSPASIYPFLPYGLFQESWWTLWDSYLGLARRPFSEINQPELSSAPLSPKPLSCCSHSLCNQRDECHAIAHA